MKGGGLQESRNFSRDDESEVGVGADGGQPPDRGSQKRPQKKKEPRLSPVGLPTTKNDAGRKFQLTSEAIQGDPDGLEVDDILKRTLGKEAHLGRFSVLVN